MTGFTIRCADALRQGRLERPAVQAQPCGAPTALLAVWGVLAGTHIESPPQRTTHLRHSLQVVLVIAGKAQHEIRRAGARKTLEPFRDA